jgi:hypothetical protein
MTTPPRPVLRATLVAAATAGALFVVAVAIAVAMQYRAPSYTADSGMMAGLVPLFWVLAGAAVLLGGTLCAALAGAASAIAATLDKWWAGIAIIAVLSLLLACGLAALAATAQQGLAAAAFGAGAMLTGALAGAFASREAAPRAPRPKPSPRSAAVIASTYAASRERVRAAGERLDGGVARWAGRADGSTRWRAVVERRALLLLIFVGFAGFALFACLGIPEVAPWYYRLGYTDGAVNALLFHGSQPWLGFGARFVPLDAHLSQVWITALAFGSNATGLAALVFAALARRRD